MISLGVFSVLQWSEINSCCFNNFSNSQFTHFTDIKHFVKGLLTQHSIHQKKYLAFGSLSAINECCGCRWYNIYSMWQRSEENVFQNIMPPILILQWKHSPFPVIWKFFLSLSLSYSLSSSLGLFIVLHTHTQTRTHQKVRPEVEMLFKW